jgi:Xaa-Pro aminopeptidase
VLDDVLHGHRGVVGRSERDLARAVEDGCRDRAAEVGFATIVASGPNGAVPHHAPTDRVVRSGDLITIDAGARVAGYHADTTRTVAAGRLPPDRALGEVHALVAAAQDLGVAAAIVGASGRDVDGAARDHLAAAGYGEQFVHGCGHGVGLDIHEAPAVSSTSSASLHDRTALTVEPGVYLPGRGGVRIEDTVVVTTDGPVRLTTSPHDLLVV